MKVSNLALSSKDKNLGSLNILTILSRRTLFFTFSLVKKITNGNTARKSMMNHPLKKSIFELSCKQSKEGLYLPKISSGNLFYFRNDL